MKINRSICYFLSTLPCANAYFLNQHLFTAVYLDRLILNEQNKVILPKEEQIRKKIILMSCDTFYSKGGHRE
jgi:hypothetical protein